MSDEDSVMGVAGAIIIFSFVSIIFIFLSLVSLGAMNNYGSYELYKLSKDFINNGLMHDAFSNTLEVLANTTLDILPFIDILFLISLISMVGGSLLFSYFAKRENYFSIFNFAIFGIIIFVYIGGIFLELTNWFRDNILLTVFPTYSSFLPIFNWYLDNVMFINIFLIVACVIANFVHLDLLKFNDRKKGESLDEI